MRKKSPTYETELANFKSAEESKRIAALLDGRRTHLAAITKDWEEVASSLETSRSAEAGH